MRLLVVEKEKERERDKGKDKVAVREEIVGGAGLNRVWVCVV